MKSLIKKIYNSPFILNVRNTIGIRKNPIYFGNIKKNFMSQIIFYGELINTLSQNSFSLICLIYIMII